MTRPNSAIVLKRYEAAREAFAEKGVDTDIALARLKTLSLTLPCWQADDVKGSESLTSADVSVQATGGYPGRARNNEELRLDLAKALSLIPGNHRVGLHAMYGDFGGKRIDRDAVEPSHFAQWAAWAGERKISLDFNCTCFAHPKAESGFTLSHADPAIRGFWIEHVQRARTISAYLGKRQGSACLHNLWIPDGSKDIRYDAVTPRAILEKSLDALFRVKHPETEMKDFLESKLFGIASEAYVVGSFEFYMGYALTRGLPITLDLGHFHPTESVADKISSILLFSKELMLHVSRGVRWDSDHVPIFDDVLRELAQRIVRDGFLDRVHVGLDFFDGSINRVGAYVVGARAVLKSFLSALLEPDIPARKAENESDYFTRLALVEEMKALPAGAVWDYHCETQGVPPGDSWIQDVSRYGHDVLAKR
ncbi:MAG: L-rhamnose isomerase [Candidatus Aminicenantales bacterium]